jgi:hypothetical protein
LEDRDFEECDDDEEEFQWWMSLVGYDADANVKDMQLKHRGKT